MKNKMIYVEWIDACGTTSGWAELGPVIKSLYAKVISMGFKIGEDKEYLYMASTITNDDLEEVPDSYNGAHSIPKGCIKKIRVLK